MTIEPSRKLLTVLSLALAKTTPAGFQKLTAHERATYREAARRVLRAVNRYLGSRDRVKEIEKKMKSNPLKHLYLRSK